MVLPTIRASLSRDDVTALADLASGGGPEARSAAMERLDGDGADALLDDPRTLNAALTDSDVRLRPALVFYVLVRQALLETGVHSPVTADYVASVLFEFHRTGRAYRLTDQPGAEYRYIVDHLAGLTNADASQRFLVSLHLGDLALWFTGLFPDHLSSRVRRRGAPSASYYERVGIAGYRKAASSEPARRMGLDGVLASVAEHFGGVRVALNRLSDRYLWRGGGDPVEKLLREVSRHA